MLSRMVLNWLIFFQRQFEIWLRITSKGVTSADEHPPETKPQANDLLFNIIVDIYDVLKENTIEASYKYFSYLEELCLLSDPPFINWKNGKNTIVNIISLKRVLIVRAISPCWYMYRIIEKEFGRRASTALDAVTV